MAKGFKFCCPALELACSRANENQRIGIQTGSLFSKSSGKRLSCKTVVVIFFPKAKKGDESKYGFKSEFKNTTYGLCKFCPFCGARLIGEEEKAKKPEREAAAPRSGRKRDGRVVGDGAEPGPVQPSDG